MDPKTGGPAQAIRYLFPYFNNLECSPEVICLDNVDINIYRDTNLRIIALGKRIGLWQYNSKLYPWLLNNLCNYDFIIIHGLWIFHSFAVTRAISKLKRNPSVKVPRVYVMCHGMLDPWFQKSKTRFFKSIRNWLYWKLIESSTIEQADGILFTCEEEMKLAKTSFIPYKPKNEINVGYGIENPPLFSLSMKETFYFYCPSVRSKKYLLFIGRIHPKKGLDILIDAYSILLQSDIYSKLLQDLDLVIAGPGMESSFGRKINTKVKTNKSLISKVHFAGMLTGAAKWGALYGSEAFVLSSHQENFGIAVVEALACSKPVLISNQVNIWREIESGSGGIIADDNTDAVIQQLKHFLLLEPSNKSKMGNAARKVFEDYFTVENAAKKLLNAIKS